MGKVFVDEDCGVPQLGCTDCGKCSSLMGRSLCSIKDRGCCHYFPEFNLAEIHRIVKLPGGMDVLDIILGHPGATVYNYYIHVKGSFDQQGYEEYLQKGELLETGSIRDHTIFFRSCPFVKPREGCSFPPRFRTTVCNFFLCVEILENPEYQLQFREYMEERTRYSRWIYRESTELQHILMEQGVNLVTDFSRCMELLRGLPLNEYEFPRLPAVEY